MGKSGLIDSPLELFAKAYTLAYCAKVLFPVQKRFIRLANDLLPTTCLRGMTMRQMKRNLNWALNRKTFGHILHRFWHILHRFWPFLNRFWHNLHRIWRILQQVWVYLHQFRPFSLNLAYFRLGLAYFTTVLQYFTTDWANFGHFH